MEQRVTIGERDHDTVDLRGGISSTTRTTATEQPKASCTRLSDPDGSG